MQALPVLDLVVRPAGQLLSDLRPLVSKPPVRRDEHLVRVRVTAWGRGRGGVI